MRDNSTIKIRLFVADPTESNDLNNSKERTESLVKLCNKVKNDFVAKGKNVEFSIIAFDNTESGKKECYSYRINSDAIDVFMIDNIQDEVIEERIIKTIEHVYKPGLLVRIQNRIKKIVNNNKKTDIRLFVACPFKSDTLIEQKDIIVDTCAKLNEDFAKEFKNVRLIPVVYDNPERREEVGVNHIKKKADIVIFLIDENFDGSLKKKLSLTVRRNRRRERPELLVYTNNNASRERIKNIIGKDGWIYDLPNNNDELIKNVKERLTEHVRKYKNKKRIQRWRNTGWILIGVLFGIELLFAYSYFESTQKRLLIVGGGSARNLLKTEYEIDIDNNGIENSNNNYKNWLHLFASSKHWLFAPMPSGEAFRIMTEEIIKNHASYKDRPYYPVIISAQRACESDFTKKFSDSTFRQKGIVVGKQLGIDWLVVYGNNTVIGSLQNSSDKSIFAASIKAFIDEQDSLMTAKQVTTIPTTIYLTSENSGTLNTYIKKCSISSINEHPCLKPTDNIFTDIDTLSEEDFDKKWIALGSHYYFPKAPKSRLIDSLIVIDNDGRIPKPVFVYFMLYKEKDSYYLPKATEKLLKKIEFDDEIINHIRKLGEHDTIIINDIDTVVIKDSQILYELPFIKQKRK